MSTEWTGTWHNQWGSEIHVEIDAAGQVKGRFFPPGAKESFALLGFVRGDLVAFTVDFGKHGAITSWVGHARRSASGVRVETLWHMTVVTPHPTRPEERWQSIHSGSDVFTRGPVAAVDRPLRMPPLPSGLA